MYTQNFCYLRLNITYLKDYECQLLWLALNILFFSKYQIQKICVVEIYREFYNASLIFTKPDFKVLMDQSNTFFITVNFSKGHLSSILTDKNIRFEVRLTDFTVSIPFLLDTNNFFSFDKRCII